MTDKTPAARLELVDGRATITLNQPVTRNSITPRLGRALARIGNQLLATPGIRLVVIQASGRDFSVGGSLEYFVDNIGDIRPAVEDLLADVNQFVAALESLDALVLTSIQGVAAGGGLALALLGDVRVMADDARLVPAYAQLGLSPDAGCSIALARVLGAQRALHLLLCEVEITAARAYETGLVSEVVPRADLARRVDQLAERLLEIGPGALATKRLLRSARRLPLEAQLAEEGAELLACMERPAFAERLARLRSAGAEEQRAR